jgi:hypothetical protein
MVRVYKPISMVIIIRDNSSMGYLKVLVSISGLMDHFLKVISNKELEMDMEFGKVVNKMDKSIKDITCSIKNMDMDYMIGLMDIFIKDFGWMTYGMEKELYFITTK